MLASCQPWRSSVFLVYLAGFPGLGQTSPTTTAADCSASTGSSGYLNIIPSCALSCVQEFIRTQYTSTSACCSGTDIDCLCRTSTISGLTLGEGALACIVGSCSSDISTDGSAAYAICNDVPGALPETHAAITATRVSVVTETTPLASTTAPSASGGSTGVSTVPTTSVLATSTLQSSSTLKTTAETTAETTATTITSLPITTATTSPSTTTTSTATSTASATNTSLSSPAVIGVSIASGVSAIFLMAVAIFFCGRRLRHKRLREEAAPQSFEIGGEMSEPPDFTAAAIVVPPFPPTQPSQVSQGATGPKFHQFPAQPVVRGQGPLVILTQSTPTGANANEPAMSPDTDYNASPQSQTSQRSLSRLLPEGLAIHGIVPEPLRVIRQPTTTNSIRIVGGPRPTSEATVFDEDESQPSNSNNSNSSKNSNNIFGPPLDKSKGKSQHGSSMRAVGLPAGPRSMLSPLRTQQKQNPYDSNGYSHKWDKEPVPIPGASRPPGSGMSPAQHAANRTGDWNRNSNKPIQRNFSRLGRGPRSLTTPTQTNPNTPWSRNTLAPNGIEATPADSSYETIMVEDDWTTTERSKLSLPQPRQSQKQQQRLEPVSERFPLPTKSPLRYPAVPRSAAIVPATAQGMRKSHVAEVYYENPQEQPSTVTRMPLPPLETDPLPEPTLIHELGSGHRSRSASPAPSSTSSNLLAKRRGETVADKMESQFRSGVQPKPGISPKVVVVDSNGDDEAVQSPPSAKKHNITPTRRGEDLYLRVD